jgi:ADP-glucose pyrophosphorylase
MTRNLILAATALLLTVPSAFAAPETIKGTITDSMCSAKHVAGTKDDVACINKCMAMGDKAVLVTAAGKVYKIDNQDAVKAHLGHKVTVTGNVVSEGTIHIDKVAM